MKPAGRFTLQGPFSTYLLFNPAIIFRQMGHKEPVSGFRTSYVEQYDVAGLSIWHDESQVIGRRKGGEVREAGEDGVDDRWCARTKVSVGLKYFNNAMKNKLPCLCCLHIR